MTDPANIPRLTPSQVVEAYLGCSGVAPAAWTVETPPNGSSPRVHGRHKYRPGERAGQTGETGETGETIGDE